MALHCCPQLDECIKRIFLRPFAWMGNCNRGCFSAFADRVCVLDMVFWK